MSDPVTHAEIEDVLSSIRRLVSEDTRGEPAAPEPAARLVLTPALRVQETEPEVAEPDVAEPEQGFAEPDQDSAGAGADPLAVPQDQTAEAPVDPATALQFEHPIAFRHHRISQPEAEAEAEAEPEAGPAVPETAEFDPAAEDAQPQNWDVAPQTAAAEPRAEAEAPAEEEELRAEPPAAAPQAPWADPAATLYAAAAGAAPDSAPAGSATDESAADTADRGTAGARAASVVRKIAELEARGSRSQEDAPQHWEPDSKTEGPFASAAADTAIAWQDEPAAAPRAAKAAQDGGASQAPEPGVNDGDAIPRAEDVAEAAFTGAALEALGEGGDSYLDEDSLRDLVASIVREELQGPLGERITRNVRKLVRREIHRALAAHDLL